MAKRNAHKGLLTIAAFLTLMLALTGCAPSAQQPAATTLPIAASAEVAAATATLGTEEYQLITAQEAKKMMDTETGLTILDVREPSEYSSGHIPNAKSLPLGDIATLAAKALPDKRAKILVYCRSGRRSQSAAAQLIALGYSHVFDFGGILQWPYEVVK